MDITLYAILISLVSAFGWGIGNALQKPIVKAISATNLIIYRGIIISVITGILLLLNIHTQNFDIKYIFIGVLITLLSYGGLFYLVKALEKGAIGVVLPINSSRIVITTLIATLFLNDNLNKTQMLCILVIFIGIVASTIDLHKFKNSDFMHISSGVPFALLSALSWGIGLALFSIPTKVLGVFLFTFLVEITNLIIAITQNVYSRSKLDLKVFHNKDLLFKVLIMGLSTAIANISMILGYDTGKVSIVTAVSSTSPLISALIGIFVFKEILTKQKYLSGIVIIIGIIALGYFS